MSDARTTELLAEMPAGMRETWRIMEWLDATEPTGHEPYSVARLCHSLAIDEASITAVYVLTAYIARQAQPRWLRCGCCGEDTWGRQWSNRDHGYGMCERCGNWHRERYGEGSILTVRHFPLASTATHMAGIRGVHWGDIPNAPRDRWTS